MEEHRQPSAGQGSSIQGNITINAPVKGNQVSIGQVSSINVDIVIGAPPINQEDLKGGLDELYTNLGALGLPTPILRAVQRATDRAAELAEQPSAEQNELAKQVREIGETLKSSGGTVEAGTSAAVSIAKIAGILGPVVVGGARAVAAWFGLHLP